MSIPAIFNCAHFLDCDFMIQLPYFSEGTETPICIDVTPMDAQKLVCMKKTHKLMFGGGDFYVLTPVVKAETNALFQIGEERL